MNADILATLACQRGANTIAKRRNCPCEPCLSRLEIFGTKAIGVPRQEQRRAALAKGEITTLKAEPA